MCPMGIIGQDQKAGKADQLIEPTEEVKHLTTPLKGAEPRSIKDSETSVADQARGTDVQLLGKWNVKPKR